MSSCSGYPQSSQPTVAKMTLASLLATEPKSRMIIEYPFASISCSGCQEKALGDASRAHSLVI